MNQHRVITIISHVIVRDVRFSIILRLTVLMVMLGSADFNTHLPTHVTVLFQQWVMNLILKKYIKTVNGLLFNEIIPF